MKGILRRLRGALGLGAVWAGGGAAVGGLIELIANLFPGIYLGFIDMWIPTLAIPGFIGGVIFAAVLRITAGRRRFDELSLPHVAAWGAVGGVVLGGFLVFLGVHALILVPAVGLSTFAASLSLVLARMAEGDELLAAGAEADEVGLTEQERRELLG